MDITKKTLGAFRIDFKSAVKALEGQYGVMVELGNISYTDNSFTSKVTVINGLSEKEVEQNIFAHSLDRYGYRFPEITMQHHTEGLRYNGHKIRIVELKSSPKYPIIFEYVDRLFHREEGKRFKASYNAIKKAINPMTLLEEVEASVKKQMAEERNKNGKS